jgi:glycine dehydrogenase subunit 2
MSLGSKGLKQVAEWAVINNNYLIKKLLEVRGVSISWPNRGKLQEARFSLQQLKDETGVSSYDFNMRAADYGINRFFASHEPQIVPEPVTPEPGETASKEDLDRFVEIFHSISEEAYRDPEIVKTAPHRCAVHRINRQPLEDFKQANITWKSYLEKQEDKK